MNGLDNICSDISPVEAEKFCLIVRTDQVMMHHVHKIANLPCMPCWGYRAAYGMEIKEVIMLVTQAVLQFPLIEDQDLDSNGYLKSYGQVPQITLYYYTYMKYIKLSSGLIICTENL